MERLTYKKRFMTTEQKYRMALLQLQQYSDNEYILVEGVSLNIQEELENLKQTT